MTQATEILQVKGRNGVTFPCTRDHYEVYKNDLTIVAETPKLIAAPEPKKALPAPKKTKRHIKKITKA